jgi:hypothetical protein
MANGRSFFTTTLLDSVIFLARGHIILVPVSHPFILAHPFGVLLVALCFPLTFSILVHLAPWRWA